MFSLKCLSKEACFLSLFLVLSSCHIDGQRHENVPYNGFSTLETDYLNNLDSCVYFISKIESSKGLSHIPQYFLKARQYFKKSEPILSFIDVENYNALNGPNILKVEEEDFQDIKKNPPHGFQVLEENIFITDRDLKIITKEAGFIKNRLALIRKNTTLDHYKPYHFLWMFRNSIVRVATTGTTGFDSPVLQNSLKESQTVYQSLNDYLLHFKDRFNNPGLYRAWLEEIQLTKKQLDSDFKPFDRYTFIKQRTDKQLQLWNRTVKDWNIRFPFAMALNNDIEHLFSKETFNIEYFSSKYALPLSEKSIALGKKLFYDTQLSGNGEISCATCHKPELAFTDGKAKAIGKAGKVLARNTPTLYYSGFQKGFFHDKRVGNIEGQITGVVEDPNEFHSDLLKLEKSIKNNSGYVLSFAALFKDSITQDNIRRAIAAYVRSIAPFDSEFDKNIRGENENLSEQEILGFNLFMGEAACATCHFPPLFNGTVPPDYRESEMEALGVPATFANLQIDPDPGRYNVYKTSERKYFFKTPTIRNVEYTAPYMHNGVYDSLGQVMEFYNIGGGNGLGFNLEHQTLPFDSLNLTEDEQQAIIAFMKSLSDPLDNKGHHAVLQ